MFLSTYFFFCRYCLDGPVIFTEEVIWLCEDCEQETGPCPMTDSDSDDSITSEDDVIARPILDANWRYEFFFLYLKIGEHLYIS
jgi:hypothetical protein